MATLRELKGRIGSVRSSEKITGAMKMISSAKMHKAEQALRQLQPFRGQIETIIANLAASDAAFSSPLMEARPVEKLTLVVWGSDDGLCGAYNVNIFKQLLAQLANYRQQLGDSVEITIIPVGAKIAKAAKKLNLPNVKVEESGEIDSKSTDKAVTAFTNGIRDSFLNKVTDRVDTLYTEFKSVSRQRIVSHQLLPITQEVFAAGQDKKTVRPYIFEPSAEIIFRRILPMYLMAVMQDIFTENRASEQASRVMAMQSANDNAKKLIDQLQLEYNKLRQAAITTELLDILGGQAK